LHILLIATDPACRPAVEAQLVAPGVTVEIQQVSDEAALAAALQGGHSDLAIIDQDSAWIDTLELLRSLHQRCPEPPLILLVSEPTPESLRQAIDAGITDYIIKSPVQLPRFGFLLHCLTQRSREQRALASVEAAWKQSELKYRTLTEQISGIFYVAHPDPQGGTAQVSSQIENLLGISVEEWQKDPRLWSKHIHPDDRDRVLADYHHAVDTGGQFVSEYRMVARDGHTVWFRDLAVVMRASSHQPPLVHGVMLDVTARRTLDEELRANEARLRQALRVGRMGYLDWDLKSDAITWSRETYVLFGVDPATFSPTIDSTLQLVHPDDRERVRAGLKAALNDDLPYDLEHRMVQPDGRVVYVHSQAELMRDLQGHPTRLFGTVVDISARKQTQEALAASEAQYRRLYESIRDGFGRVDMDGRILEVNPAFLAITAYPEAEIHQLKYQELTPPRWHDFEAAIVREQILVRGYSDVYEKEYVRRDGSVFPIELRAYLIRDEAGEPTGMWAFVRDISERKHAQEKLVAYAAQLQSLSHQLWEAQENERRHLARELHDEIGQDLTAIRMNLRPPLKDETASALGLRLEETLRVVDGLIRKTQDLSFTLRPTMLDDLGLEAALRSLTRLQASRGHLNVEFWASPFPRRLNTVIETACFRVAQEALTNVLRHALAKEVSVLLRLDQDQLELVIHDDGVGFNVAAVRQGDHGKRALGLLGMEERVSLAGGRFECRSSPEHGTEIHAWFPLHWRE
jgi:PAS domain S-box-containing protein